MKMKLINNGTGVLTVITAITDTPVKILMIAKL